MNFLKILLCLGGFTFGYASSVPTTFSHSEPDEVNVLIDEMLKEMVWIQKQYDVKIQINKLKIKQINQQILVSF